MYPFFRYGLAYIVFREFRCYQGNAAQLPTLAGTAVLITGTLPTTRAHDVRDARFPCGRFGTAGRAGDESPGDIKSPGDERGCSSASPAKGAADGGASTQLMRGGEQDNLIRGDWLAGVIVVAIRLI